MNYVAFLFLNLLLLVKFVDVFIGLHLNRLYNIDNFSMQNTLTYRYKNLYNPIEPLRTYSIIYHPSTGVLHTNDATRMFLATL